MRKIYIAHSIAFTDGKGNIYINKNLKQYNKNLFKRILNHEEAHAMGHYGFKDFALDFHNDISQIELLNFCLKHPSGFAQYCPIIKTKGIWFYSWLSALKLIFTGGLVWLIIAILL